MAQTCFVSCPGPLRLWVMAEQIIAAVEALEAGDAAEAAMLAAGGGWLRM